ncbi:MAG: S8 family serine peptidase [Woeseia sp.]
MTGDTNKMAKTAVTAVALAIGIVSLANAADTNRYLVQYELGNKADIMAALPANAVVHHEFDRYGIMAVSMTSSEIVALTNLAPISAASEDPIWSLNAQVTPYGIDMVNARDTWDADRDGAIDTKAATGEGINVCIVDTGIYAAHEDLGAGGVNILAGRSFTGEDWDQDRQGHGTHVAGTIAAMNNDTGVVGVSPGTVNLLIGDVFNDAGEGQSSSTIFAAVEWCADNGANIISMSLGGPVGLPLPILPDVPAVSFAGSYQDLYDDGILIIAAAGNDGDVRFNFPGSYPSVMSVAALDSTELKAEFSNFNSQVEIAAPGVSVLSTYPFENTLQITGGPRYMANAIAFSSTGDLAGAFVDPLADGGTCNDAVPAGTYDRKVVLCERGDAAFQVKIDNAGNGGATGVVIYNNVPGNVSATYGEDFVSTTPAISLSQEDGQDALNYVGDESTMIVNLESVQGYAELSGTSMATPHASAIAAVQWGACTDLTNDQIRAHLAGTTRNAAGDVTGAIRDPEYGYGLVQAKAGVDALRDGIDNYTSNADGSSPANVECYMPIPEDPTDPGDPADEGSKASGSGWLDGNPANNDTNGDSDNDSDKISFSFKAEEKKDGKGLKGKFKLKDKMADIKIDVKEIDSFTVLNAACGPVAAGDNAVQITGEGTLNDLPASFRMCAADVDKKGKGNDTFYLECTAGCSYTTTASGATGVLGGGKVKVKMQKPEAAAEAEAESAPADSSEATIVTLGPLLLDDTLAGGMQVLSAQVLNDSLRAIAGSPVTLQAVHVDGTVQILEGTTGANGKALFTVILAGDSVEYRAIAGEVESNTVAPTPKN